MTARSAGAIWKRPKVFRWMVLGLGLLALGEFLLWPGSHLQLIEYKLTGYSGRLSEALSLCEVQHASLLILIGVALLVALPWFPQCRARGITLTASAGFAVFLEQLMEFDFFLVFPQNAAVWVMTIFLYVSCLLFPLLWGCALAVWECPGGRREALAAAVLAIFTAGALLVGTVLPTLWAYQFRTSPYFPIGGRHLVGQALGLALLLAKLSCAVQCLRLVRGGVSAARAAALAGAAAFAIHLVYHLLAWTRLVYHFDSMLTLPYALLGFGFADLLTSRLGTEGGPG